MQNKANFKMGKIAISTAPIKAYVDKQRTMNNERYSKQTQSNPISNAETLQWCEKSHPTGLPPGAITCGGKVADGEARAGSPCYVQRWQGGFPSVVVIFDMCLAVMRFWQSFTTMSACTTAR